MIKALISALPVFLLCLANTACCAENTIDQAWTHYLKGDYNKTIQACGNMAREKALKGQCQYLTGLAFLKLNRPEDARASFELVIKNYPGSALVQESLLGIADSYFLESEFEKAQQAYNAMLARYPLSDYASIAYLAMGKVMREQGKWKQAQDIFNKIIREYPSSIETGQAKILYARPHFFTIQTGAFSNRENASRLIASMKKKGYHAASERERSGDSLFYKVKTGSFSSRKTAQEELERLKKDGFAGRIIN
jgi:tetratricopeptide (TPR) repeat protein